MMYRFEGQAKRVYGPNSASEPEFDSNAFKCEAFNSKTHTQRWLHCSGWHRHDYSRPTFTLQPPSLQHIQAAETKRCEEASHVAQMWDDVSVWTRVTAKFRDSHLSLARGCRCQRHTEAASAEIRGEEVSSTWSVTRRLTRARRINERRRFCWGRVGVAGCKFQLRYFRIRRHLGFKVLSKGFLWFSALYIIHGGYN